MIARNALATLAAAVLPAAAMAAPVYTATGFVSYFGDEAAFDADFVDDDGDDVDVALFGSFDGSSLLLDLLVSDDDGTLLEASAVRSFDLDIDGADNVVAVTLDGATGSQGDLFASGVDVTVRFDDADDDGAAIVPVAVAVDVAAPIPLPASLPLVLLGAGALAMLRRRA